jgi:hypothetical protein
MNKGPGLLLLIVAAVIAWQLWRCSPDRPATYGPPAAPGAKDQTDSEPPPTPEEEALRRARIQNVIRQRAGRL